jgi:hypothetical protein
LAIFANFLGGRFTTRVLLGEYLVNVSEFLQSFPYLNGYGIFICILLMKFAGINPRK